MMMILQAMMIVVLKMSQICVLCQALHTLINDSDDDFESEPTKVKYDMLLDSFQEIHAEATRLQYKVNRLSSERKDYGYRIDILVEENDKLKQELEIALKSTKNVKTGIHIVEKNCDNFPVHRKN